MLEVYAPEPGNLSVSRLRIISIAAIVIGFVIETFVFAGGQIGNGIAALGIIVFVYDYFKPRQRPQLSLNQDENDENS